MKSSTATSSFAIRSPLAARAVIPRLLDVLLYPVHSFANKASSPVCRKRPFATDGLIGYVRVSKSDVSRLLVPLLPPQNEHHCFDAHCEPH